MSRDKDSIGEEASAFGQRMEGATKDAFGDMTDNQRLEREGERENAMGDARQESNDATRGARRMVTGLFHDRESAEGAYRSMHERGYGKDDVNLLMSEETRDRYFKHDDADKTELGSKALEGAGVGSAIGGTVGAVLAAVAAIGTSVAIPGLGLLVAGPIAAGLAGAGAGSLTGGLVGALIGSGIPEERARAYDEGVRKGGIVMGVNARSDEDAEFFERDWRDTYRGQHVYR